MCDFNSFLKSLALGAESPRTAETDLRRNVPTCTPGMDDGYWNERNIPALARSKTSISSNGVPLNLTEPAVISYAGWPITTLAKVDLPAPFLPIIA